jgi:hypothetical protein
MLKKWMVALCLGALSLVSVSAQERVTYVTQPDEVTVFLNDVAYVKDTISLANNADVSISLPSNMFEDTLIVRENGEEATRYSINAPTGVRTLNIGAGEGDGGREITLEYLATGISWTPNYRMNLDSADETQVAFTYYAALTNNSFTLDEAVVKLAAGRVDAYQSVPLGNDGMAMNQMYAPEDLEVAINSLATGNVTIQYTYDIGALTTTMGDTIYTKILDQSFPARRILLWNAQFGNDISVIYKVRNASDLPITDGVVRSYQDGLFIGSDNIEFTPIGSEGSVTVGAVQQARAERTETITAIDGGIFSYLDTQHDITLTLTNFSQEALTVEVVDVYGTDAQDFTYSQVPAEEGGNVLRWVVNIAAGETVTLTYQYKSEY